MAMFTLKAETISEGVSLGSVLHVVPTVCIEKKKDMPAEERLLEREQLEAAITAAHGELEKTMAEITETLGQDKADIFECHLAILEDEDFQNDMFALIADEGYSASYAVEVVSEKNALEMEEMDDPLFAARAADFRDIGQRLMSQLSRNSAAEESFPPSPAVVAATMLTPGQTIRFNKDNLRGFIICKGGKNSHAAILARSLGIPAVVISETMLSVLKDGMQVVLNYKPEELIVDPDEQVQQQALAIQEKQQTKKAKLALLKDKPAQTLDGTSIGLYANGGSMKDLSAITAAKPDGIGLFRTEFLFMEQDSLPDEEIQSAYYRQVLQTIQGKPVIFRLLDIGGDKPLSYLPREAEKNPFLGWRGIRFLLDNQEILRSQIRSMLIASQATGQTVRIMVPMISAVAEMRAVADIIGEEQRNVGGNAIAGMMVETPAAALTVAAYKGISHFISIGSNDLTQYTLAVDRESEKLSHLYSEFHPAVLLLIHTAVQAAHANGMEAGLCGEFASKPEGCVLLAGAGFDELSMSVSALPYAKEIIRSCTQKELQELFAAAMTMPDAESVWALSHCFLKDKQLV